MTDEKKPTKKIKPKKKRPSKGMRKFIRRQKQAARSKEGTNQS